MQRSPFPKLILEMTILRMVQLRPSLPLDEIITKLRILEGRLLGENVQGTPVPGDAVVPEGIPSVTKESSSPPSSEGKEEIWRRFLEEVQRKKASLASMLEQATLLTLTPEKIEIGINQDSFLWEKIGEKESLAILKDTGRVILKRDVEIKISHYPSGTDGSVSRKTNNHKEQQLKKAQEEAINNPAVKDILDIFGGKIVDVKINQ
jgi:hypothetical protein